MAPPTMNALRGTTQKDAVKGRNLPARPMLGSVFSNEDHQAGLGSI